ncbi:hypothetical protein LEP1GSC043_2520 [Leptospira weilii str. Ecochallenge]|uniref:Uncharacterized protein n=1 Tax=Leptospira weilii str. Ecochallenge TaxID=1049986 RepID=N1U9P7_9LEPT|nr:hypothetical protein LEP1GSC043_2520 [Leptospira weilii str. Ecochallenge]
MKSAVLFALWFCSCKGDPSTYSSKSFSEKSLNGKGKFLCAILVNQTANDKIYFQKTNVLIKHLPPLCFIPSWRLCPWKAVI